MKLRRADINDGKLLYEWACDKEVRKNAFSKDPFTYDSHMKWLKGKLESRDTLIFIGEIPDSIPVGQVRIDIEGDLAEIDYSVDVQYRGMGYGKRLLLLIQEPGLLPDNVRLLKGSVLSENMPSQKAFEAAGFTLSGKGSKRGMEYVIYEKPYN